MSSSLSQILASVRTDDLPQIPAPPAMGPVGHRLYVLSQGSSHEGLLLAPRTPERDYFVGTFSHHDQSRRAIVGATTRAEHPVPGVKANWVSLDLPGRTPPLVIVKDAKGDKVVGAAIDGGEYDARELTSDDASGPNIDLARLVRHRLKTAQYFGYSSPYEVVRVAPLGGNSAVVLARAIHPDKTMTAERRDAKPFAAFRIGVRPHAQEIPVSVKEDGRHIETTLARFFVSPGETVDASAQAYLRGFLEGRNLVRAEDGVELGEALMRGFRIYLGPGARVV